jgi:hypothetical protein
MLRCSPSSHCTPCGAPTPRCLIHRLSTLIFSFRCQVSHTLAMFTARQLLLQETEVLRLSFITSAVYAFACALTGVMWREWVVTGGGNANFVFGVRFVFINISHACASSRSLPAVPCLWLIRKRPFLSAVQRVTLVAGTRCCRRCWPIAGGYEATNPRQQAKKNTLTERSRGRMERVK